MASKTNNKVYNFTQTPFNIIFYLYFTTINNVEMAIGADYRSGERRCMNPMKK